MEEFRRANTFLHQIPIGRVGCISCDSQSMALLQRHTLTGLAFSKQLLFHQIEDKGFWMIDRFIHHKFAHIHQDWKQLAARELAFLRKIQNKPETLKEITNRQLLRFNNMEICLARDLKISYDLMLKAVIIPRHLVVSQSRSSPTRLTLAANVKVGMQSLPDCEMPNYKSTGCSEKDDNIVNMIRKDLCPKDPIKSKSIHKDPKNQNRLKKTFYCKTLDSHIESQIEYNQLLLQDPSSPNEIPRIWLLQDFHSLIIFTDIKSFFTSLYLTPHTALHQAELFYVDKNFQPTFDYSKIDKSKGFQVAIPLQASFGTVDLPKLAESSLNLCLDKYIQQLENLTKLDELFICMSRRYLQANYIDDGTIMIHTNDIKEYNAIITAETSKIVSTEEPIAHTMAITICTFITEFLDFSNFHLKGFECEEEELCKKLNNLPLLAHKLQPNHPWKPKQDNNLKRSIKIIPKGSLKIPTNQSGTLGFEMDVHNESPCTNMNGLKAAKWEDLLKIEYNFKPPDRPKPESVHNEWVTGPSELNICDQISFEQKPEDKSTFITQEPTLLIPDVRLSKVDPSKCNLELMPYIYSKFSPTNAKTPFGKSLGRNFHFPNCTSLGVKNLTVKIGPKQQKQVTINSYEDFTKLSEKPISRRTLLSLLSQCYDISNLMSLGPRASILQTKPSSYDQRTK